MPRPSGLSGDAGLGGNAKVNVLLFQALADFGKAAVAAVLDVVGSKGYGVLSVFEGGRGSWDVSKGSHLGGGGTCGRFAGHITWPVSSGYLGSVYSVSRVNMWALVLL